jgi:hypothetical protein
MAEQLDVPGVRSLPDIVIANHKVLAVEPKTFPSVNGPGVSKHRNQCKLLTVIRRSHD